MIKRKTMAVVALCAVFMAFALGSGSDGSTRDSVKIDSNGSTEAGSSSAKESNSEAKAEIKYEITDTSFEYYTNSIGNVEYYGFVEITNTGNCDIYLDNCTFDLEDNDGHLLQSDSYISSCPNVISPGEKGYFYNSIGSTYIDKGVSFDNGVKLVPQIKLTQAKGKPTSYPVSDVTVRAGDYGDVKVTGRVENTSDKDISYLYVNIIFYDANGKVIAISGTSITDIGAGMKGSFDASTMYGNDNLKLENIANTEVIAEDMYLQF